MVKANGYGIIDYVEVETLEEAGVDFFAVSSLDEALRLRKHNVKDEILILGYVPIDTLSLVKENNLSTKADEGLLAEVIKKAIEANPKAVADYKAGKKKAVGAMVGFVMKEMKGKCDPATVNKMITEKLQ